MRNPPRLGFIARIALMPSLAALAFLLVLVMTQLTASDNEELFARVRRSVMPALQLSRSIERKIPEIQRALQDAVTAQEPARLLEADRLGEELLLQLGDRSNPDMNSAEVASLESEYASYYGLARDVASRMIRGEAGPSIEAQTEQMSERHHRLEQAIKALIGQQHSRMDAAFMLARENERRSMRVLSLIIVASLLALAAMSVLIIRSTVGRLGRAVVVAERLARGEFSAEIGSGPQDEIGRLLLAMNRMVAYLKDMAGAADRIAAGDLTCAIAPRSASDRFGAAFASMVEALNNMVSVAERIAAGELESRLTPRSPADRFSPALNSMLDSLAAASADMAKAARLKDEFLANMSHELRTPLNAVLGMSEALLDDVYGPLQPAQRRSLAIIESSGRHLLAVINDILDLSKIEAGKLELEIGSVSVESLCQTSLQFVAEAAQQKRLHLSGTIHPRVRTIRADERRLRQILINLLSNAVKFTPEGGEVALEVDVEESRESVRFMVRDTGIGISRADQARLFQPFTQLDSHLARNYAGTGLGLALVRRMAEMHGGTAAVESEPGKGSRFTVLLPWHEAPAALEPAGRMAVAQPVSAGPAVARGILLAEDNEANIATISDYLRAKGYSVSVARNGLDAVARAGEERPALILMDIHMPGMDGLEAMRRIRSQEGERHTPIVALTSLAMSGDRERCLRAGADEHMTKPLSLRALVTTIERLMRQARAAEADDRVGIPA